MAPLTPNQAQQDTRRIEAIRIVVHIGQALDQSDNHWSIYLLIQGGGSVRANMATEYGATEGHLDWFNLDYGLTNSAIHHWDIPVTQAIQVLYVARTIYTKGRHRYYFSGGGSGCRYWVWTVLHDLEAQGYIASGASNQLDLFNIFIVWGNPLCKLIGCLGNFISGGLLFVRHRAVLEFHVPL